MGGFSTPTAGGGGGITKLSELTIDADKDWQQKGITNIKEIASSMAQGDMVFKGLKSTNLIQRLAASYGVGYSFLHAQNTGIDEPEWIDIQDIIAYITGAVNRMIKLPSLVISAPSLSLAVAEDHSGGGFTSNLPLTIPKIGRAHV